jgi:polyisoprenoid-binding protein YceI
MAAPKGVALKSGGAVMKRCCLVLAALVVPVLSQAESYNIDPAKSHVGFRVGFSLGTVRGQFERFEGRAEIDGGQLVSAAGTVRAESLNTVNSRRDNHLRSSHFFHVSQYPEIAFRTTSVEPGGDGAYTVKGDLTMRGVTREVTLSGTLEPAEEAGRFAFKAQGQVNRKDWGIIWNQHTDGWDLFIKDEVNIALEGELTKAP